MAQNDAKSLKIACKIHLMLFSMAQVIYDLAFLMLTTQKSLKQKNLEKIVFLEKCFSICFAS
jgi:hypothetical protein